MTLEKWISICSQIGPQVWNRMCLWEIILGPYGFLLCSTLLFRKLTCPHSLYSLGKDMCIFWEQTLLGCQEFCSFLTDNCSANASWPAFVENTCAGRSPYASTLVFILQISCWLFSSPLCFYLLSILCDTSLLLAAGGTSLWFVPSKHMCNSFHHCVVSCSELTCGCLLWWHDLVFCNSVHFFFLLPWYFVPLSHDNSSSEAAAFLLWSYRMLCIASGNTVLLNTDEIATNPLRSGV